MGKQDKEISTAFKEFDLAIEIYRQSIADSTVEENASYYKFHAMEIEDCENAIKELRSDYF